jgi:ribosome-binding protein aMBF1 (putative translation factor)
MSLPKSRRAALDQGRMFAVPTLAGDRTPAGRALRAALKAANKELARLTRENALMRARRAMDTETIMELQAQNKRRPFAQRARAAFNPGDLLTPVDGAAIKAARIASGLTQRALANQTLLSCERLRLAERGLATSVTMAVLEKHLTLRPT